MGFLAQKHFQDFFGHCQAPPPSLSDRCHDKDMGQRHNKEPKQLAGGPGDDAQGEGTAAAFLIRDPVTPSDTLGSQSQVSIPRWHLPIGQRSHCRSSNAANVTAAWQAGPLLPLAPHPSLDRTRPHLSPATGSGTWAPAGLQLCSGTGWPRTGRPEEPQPSSLVGES